MAFYLKYRSQKVSELDSASVREGLYGILQSGLKDELPHALLFTGPRGTGKTSSARILAKAINCVGRGEGLGVRGEGENQKIKRSRDQDINDPKPYTLGPNPSLEPCNDCEACRTITLGSSLDVIEIDAASHRGIDDIRDLREKVGLAPVSLRYKVYIIDEVHMLTTEAFNALLKTLEEPPARVIFVLCTTESEKLPETIVSRCIQVRFKKASKDDIVHSLQRVVDGEKLEVGSGVLELIAEQAGGSFRDAHKMLEQLSWKEGKIELEQVKDQAGGSDQRVEGLVKLLGERNVGGCLELIEEIVSSGQNLQQIAGDLLEKLHRKWLDKVKNQSIRQAQDKQLEVKSSSQNLEVDNLGLMELIQLMDKAVMEMKYAEIEQLPLEVAIVEWLSRDETISGTRNTKEGSQNSGVSVPVQVGASSADSLQNDSKLETKFMVVTEEKQTLASDNLVGAVVTLDTVQRKWEELLNSIRPKNHSVQALLRSARPKIVDNNQLVIEVYYPFHLDKLKVETLRRMVEDSVIEVFGWKGVKLQYVLGERTGTPAKEAKVVSEEEMNQGSGASGKGIENSGFKSQNSNSKYQKFENRNSKSDTNEEDEGLIKFAMEVFGK